MFHRIDEPQSSTERDYTVTPAAFARQMEALAGAGMSACSTEALVEWMHGKAEIPRNSFVLTFDDGYSSFRENAAPVLHRFGWTASVFVVTSMLGGTDTWISGAGGSSRPLLSAADIQELAAEGFSFFSHSRRHPALTEIEPRELLREVVQSKAELEDVLGTEVGYFAYPYGKHDDTVVTAVKDAGYKAAFSVIPGFNRPGADLYRIRRLDVFGRDTPRALLRKVRLGQNDGSLLSGMRYLVKRARTSAIGP
jgi:peptidoglycan/xylan/chitin deacetylase (PgdA/CDA1 family)